MEIDDDGEWRGRKENENKRFGENEKSAYSS